MPGTRYLFQTAGGMPVVTPPAELDTTTVGRLRTITRVVVPDVSYLRNVEHRKLLLSGLRMAMGRAT